MGDLLNTLYETLFMNWFWRHTLAGIFAMMAGALLLLGVLMAVVRPRFGGMYVFGAAVVMFLHVGVWQSFGPFMADEDVSPVGYVLPLITAGAVIYMMRWAVRERDTERYNVRIPFWVLHVSLILHVAVIVALIIGSLLYRTERIDAAAAWRVVPPLLAIASAALMLCGLLATLVARAFASPKQEGINP